MPYVKWACFDTGNERSYKPKEISCFQSSWVLTETNCIQRSFDSQTNCIMMLFNPCAVENTVKQPWPVSKQKRLQVIEDSDPQEEREIRRKLIQRKVPSAMLLPIDHTLWSLGLHFYWGVAPIFWPRDHLVRNLTFHSVSWVACYFRIIQRASYQSLFCNHRSIFCSVRTRSSSDLNRCFPANLFQTQILCRICVSRRT